MKMRSIDEILQTTPENRVIEVFIEVFGEELGRTMATEFAHSPQYKDRYEQMVKQEMEHQERMKRLVQEIKTN